MEGSFVKYEVTPEVKDIVADYNQAIIDAIEHYRENKESYQTILVINFWLFKTKDITYKEYMFKEACKPEGLSYSIRENCAYIYRNYLGDAIRNLNDMFKDDNCKKVYLSTSDLNYLQGLIKLRAGRATEA